MPDIRQLAGLAIKVPFAVIRFAWDQLPGGGSDDDRYVVPQQPAQPRRQAEPAWRPTPETSLPESLVDDHVEVEVEVVAESADPEATGSPGPEMHVDDELRSPSRE